MHVALRAIPINMDLYKRYAALPFTLEQWRRVASLAGEVVVALVGTPVLSASLRATLRVRYGPYG
jgi:hypothetical protein